MSHPFSFEVFGPRQGMPVTVAHECEPDGVLTQVVERYAEQLITDGTWNTKQSLVEDALKLFFTLDPTDGRPVVFIDRDDGQRIIREGCLRFEATTTRKSKVRLGFKVEHATRARRMEDVLVVGEQIVDLATDIGHCTVENPFRIAGFSPALEAQLRADRIRRAKADGKEPDYAVNSGRFFVVENAGWSAPRTDDPHFHDRIETALVNYGAPEGFMAAWRFKEDIWCRPVEAIEAPVEGLWLGAKSAGADVFGRLVMLADKNSKKKLVKLTAQSEEGARAFYEWFDGPRRLQLPKDRQWGVAEYEAACRNGDAKVLAEPIFLNTRGGGLTYDTANRRTFKPIMELAGLVYQGKTPGMHLGRHDKITKAVERIAALKVPVEIKEQMLDDLVEFVGWATGRRMLKVYAAHIAMIDKARKALGFADAHAQPVLGIPIPARASESLPCLADLFGDR